MTMATRIVVMKKGFIQQIGSPKEIYLHPANQFVAGFIGSPSMNFIPSHINEDYTYNFFDSIFPISEDNDFHEKLKDYVSKDVTLGIRPEDIILADENATHFIEVESDVVEMMGDILLVHFKKDDTIFSAKISSDYEVLPHQTYKIAFKEKKIHFFDKETEITII
jgi:multiple sugar transport system ATP-binding protein